MTQAMIETSAPTIAANAGGLFTLPVKGDNMEPGLRHNHDFVVLTPVDRFEFDEVYALQFDGVHVFYRCQSDLRGNVKLSSDNKAYGTDETLTKEEFAKVVLGRAIGDFKVRDRHALQPMRPTNFAPGHLIAAE